MLSRPRCLLLIALLLSAICGYAQRITQMDFRNQPITDILMIVAEVAKVSIVPDETVSGNASFFFAESDVRIALRSFLSSQKLFMVEDQGIIYVSRIQAQANADGSFTMHADEIDPQQLLRALSRTARKTILFDAMPRATVTIHAENLALERIVEIILLRFPEFRVVSSADSLYVRRIETAAQGQVPVRGSGITRDAAGLYTLDFEQYRLREALAAVMELEGREYVPFIRLDTMLERMNFAAKPFEEVMRLLLEQAGADYEVEDGIVYIFEVQRRDITKRLRPSQVLAIQHWPVQDLVALLPQELANTAFFRVDRPSNSLILTGSQVELAPLIDFIGQVDIAHEGRVFQAFQLANILAKDFIALCPPRLFPIAPILAPDVYTFIAMVNDSSQAEIERLIALLDAASSALPVHLRFLRNEDFLKALPPSVVEDEVVDSGVEGLVYYIGPPGRRQQFLNELSLIDRPVPQLRYDVLVLHTSTAAGLTYGIDFEARESTADDALAIVGAFEELLSVNFNIISELGVYLGAELSLKMAEDNTRIFVDTTMTGVVGQDIKFQNTSTFRYRDPAPVDPDTGNPVGVGVTREVTSGLTLTINGWISGDGMVTMTIAAAVTERGASTGTDMNPPETFERIVNSQVRTPVGVPLVITGLIQRKKVVKIVKIPFLGDIPLIGALFTNRVESDEETEFTIYIVPRLVLDIQNDASVAGQMAELYQLVANRQ
ncbi:MAG: hypothetical protein A2087_08035 [Spirochaetes bacterium GWD1_61_31]|nr:MAG: hypothetical protein A2087_08035 [Spirochaetes bacterium GWD1_61_31]OHD43935.1 MAG: hypothetical protein A2Y35_08690 [Spirochaetes bacterium GWE1_60_18]HAP42664.1 hypothetical protein [Spirochaetaceae bacterium]HAW86043.1 hypothetical protein [Spirochaetaceae bacterium]HAX37577.1 hypothetical protein [Spirochaetaceae bacterium]